MQSCLKKESLDAEKLILASQLEEKGEMAGTNEGEGDLQMKLTKLFSGWGHRQAPTCIKDALLYENKIFLQSPLFMKHAFRTGPGRKLLYAFLCYILYL